MGEGRNGIVVILATPIDIRDLPVRCHGRYRGWKATWRRHVRLDNLSIARLAWFNQHHEVHGGERLVSEETSGRLESDYDGVVLSGVFSPL